MPLFRTLLLMGMVLLGPIRALGAPCYVGHGAEDLGLALAKVTAGDCQTRDSQWLKPYQTYLPNAVIADVIVLSKSMEIYLSKSLSVEGSSERPLLIIVEPSAQVRISGTRIASKAAGLTLRRDQVLIDGITWRDFSGPAMDISGNEIVLLHQKILQGGKQNASGVRIAGNRVRMISSEVAGGSVNGIVIEGADAFLQDVDIHDNGRGSLTGFGVVVNGPRASFKSSRPGASRIYRNGAAGILIDADQGGSAFISQVSFFQTGPQEKGLGILAKGPVLPAPEGVIAIKKSENELVVSGKLPVEKMDSTLLTNFNPENVVLEIYAAQVRDGLQGREYLGFQKGVDRTGEFSIELEKEALASVETVLVLAQDPLQKWSSVFSVPFSFGTPDQTGPVSDEDWDGDGLKNEEEDWDQDGAVDLAMGETDPRNPDTDQDGLTDGEEKKLTSLDPTKADSDGDCLPDGLEMGKGAEIFQPIVNSPVDLDENCLVRAKEGGSVKPDNGLWIGEDQTWETAVAFYDLDLSTQTDPANPDTDGDGLLDGNEDFNLNGQKDPGESDPGLSDTDGDGLADGEESICTEELPCAPDQSDRLKRDTDDDGLSDGEEMRRYRTLVNQCDTDGDQLGDGLEAGVIHAEAASEICRGLQAAGSNFHSSPSLDPARPDSDNDGLTDGVEDTNHNGWLDFNETDPSMADTDGDSLSDGVEATLDMNGDSVPDLDIRHLSHGKNCSPPARLEDLDCDGLVNARDLNSDGDGCEDSQEPIGVDNDHDGVPDVWEQTSLGCQTPSTPSGNGGSGGGLASGGVLPSAEGTEKVLEPLPITGGGGCRLTPSGAQNDSFWLFYVVLVGSLIILISARNFLGNKSINI